MLGLGTCSTTISKAPFPTTFSKRSAFGSLAAFPARLDHASKLRLLAGDEIDLTSETSSGPGSPTPRVPPTAGITCSCAISVEELRDCHAGHWPRQKAFLAC